MTDGSGQETYGYDALNRLTSVSRGANTFLYTYDLVNLTQVRYPDLTTVAYAYDDDERLQSVTSGGQTTGYSYDEAGNLKQTTLPSGNGYVETRAYDRAGRLTEVRNAKGATVLSRFASTLDAVGNPTRIDRERTGVATETHTFTYDDMDRLKSVCFQTSTCPNPSDPFIRWTYDGVGNRLTEQRPTGLTSYSYNAADELTQAGSTAYTYDQNGNQLSAGTRTFTYDLADRLKTTTLGSTTTTYTYGGDGKRLQASTGTQASKKTNYVWDANGPLPQIALERDGNNGLLRRYLYGQARISMTSGNSTYYFHPGLLGSVANLTNSSGVAQWTYGYEPFGKTRTETKDKNNAPTNFMKFTGEYLDPAGLYHLRARQYDPAAGRFLSRDPVAQPRRAPAMSQYVYADDRPTTLIDPAGLDATGVVDNRCADRWCWIDDQDREAIACGLAVGGFVVVVTSLTAVIVAGVTGGPGAAWETALALENPTTVGAVAVGAGFELSEGIPCLSLVR